MITIKEFSQKLKTYPFPLVADYLLNLYGSCVPSGAKITYGKDIELIVSEKNTNITLQECKIKNTNRLDEIIETLDNAVNNCREIIRTTYLFSPIQFKGYFKYKDEFQLTEIPNKNLQCTQLWGCKHPLVFQYKTVKYGEFSYHYYSKDIKEYLLLLNAFSFIPLNELDCGMSWIRNKDTNEIELVHNSFYDDTILEGEFLNTENLQSLPSKDYDGNINMMDYFYLPSYFKKIYEKYTLVSSEKKEFFLISAHWLLNSNAKDISSSQKYLALLNAIESLLPEQKSNEKCIKCNNVLHDKTITQSFYDFINQYSPSSDKKLIERLYRVRSALTHGSKILIQDNPMSSFIYTPKRLDDENELKKLRILTKYSIHNWLLAQ